MESKWRKIPFSLYTRNIMEKKLVKSSSRTILKMSLSHKQKIAIAHHQTQIIWGMIQRCQSKQLFVPKKLKSTKIKCKVLIDVAVVSISHNIWTTVSLLLMLFCSYNNQFLYTSWRPSSKLVRFASTRNEFGGLVFFFVTYAWRTTHVGGYDVVTLYCIRTNFRGRGLVSWENRPMKSLNHDTRHFWRHDSDDKKWQSINTHTLRCCLRLWLRNNIKSGPYGFADGY